MADAIWKPIPGFEGSYEINRNGEVRSVDRIAYGPKKKKFLKGQPIKPHWNGRFFVVPMSLGGKQYQKTTGPILEKVFPKPSVFPSDLSIADIAYAAAILDGEGSIHVRMDTKYQKIAVQVGMVDPQVVDFMAAKFGGRVVIKKRCPKDADRWKPVYLWALYCKRASAFLELVEPYLKIKGARARDAIILANMAMPRGTRIPVPEAELVLRKEIATRIKRANFHSNGALVKYAAAFEAKQ